MNRHPAASFNAGADEGGLLVLRAAHLSLEIKSARPERGLAPARWPTHDAPAAPAWRP